MRVARDRAIDESTPKAHADAFLQEEEEEKKEWSLLSPQLRIQDKLCHDKTIIGGGLKYIRLIPPRKIKMKSEWKRNIWVWWWKRIPDVLITDKELKTKRIYFII